MRNKKNKSLNKKIVSSSVSVIISLSLVLFVVGLLSLVLINAQKLSNYVKENIGFSIMIKEDVKEIELIEFNKILDAEDFTKSTRFISKEQATKELEQDLGEDFVNFLGFNPIMASIDVKLNSSYANNDSLQNISSRLEKSDVVYEVFYQKNLIKKLNSNVGKISFFLICISLILFFIAFALINNTIRLSVYSKRFIIRTMRLVGAENSFIQKPFLISGVYQGLYSAIFAIFMLLGSIQLIQTETASILNINDLQNIGLVFIVLFCSGIIISGTSTFFAVRKFIYLNEGELYN
ncbi:permease-like cell division protein FtsX [bacterium]|jgi:cell division transport system permease protein|nr:permease-like cell division protein FtsX [bacterium]MDC1024603.1 permease-like cell division protein FtsX [Flavobacteriales bacterium]|tara:strand:- start:588 stop:1466 length:879 start_codon:yes stop_codon:yes gene_type:complete